LCQPNAKVAGGGFEQCYNAQAAVAADSLLIVAQNVVQAVNDKQQIEPMLNQIAAPPDGLGEVDTLLPDTGYFSAAVGINPLIAMGRQPHHPQVGKLFWVPRYLTWVETTFTSAI
jgi:hypothetical protein